MNVSIVIPEYNPKKELLKKVINSIKKQEFNGKKEIIEVNKGLGLAASLNYGIRKAKYEIIVTLHQDCVPSNSNWLQNIIKPFKDESVVAVCSKVYDIENKKRYTPYLDEKGCAYKKEALQKVGLFDNKTFLNSGEDFDNYIKLKKIGKIAYPDITVRHDHPGYLIKKAAYKKKQNANTYGCLMRIYGLRVDGWWKAVILANIFNPHYFYWFWRGFILKKQDYKK